MTITTPFSTKPRNDADAGISADLLSSAVRDFRAGMQFLHRYAARCHANTEAIGRGNLRLLHNTLMVDSHYRTVLAEAGRGTSQRGLPISRTLFNSPEITTEIISLRQGCSFELTPDSNQLGLLMVLSGRAVQLDAHAAGDVATQLAHKGPSRTLSWKLHRWLRGANSSSPQSLRADDVVWEKPSGSEPQTLTATSAVCVVLRVRLPLAYFGAATDIDRQPRAARLTLVG